MAKKRYIRHLEYYGFPDQNGYSSEINGVDLSDIREKNKEQDEEIQDLEGEKADKKDLVLLSGTVENFITRQSEINQEFADAISGMSNDINDLKNIDTEFAEQLSAITSGVDEAMDAIENLDERVDNVEDYLSGLSETVGEIIEDYARKDDVYSKEEIDEMMTSGFSEYATKEWVEEQGYITEEEADAKYAKIEDLEELASAVESAATDIDERFEEVNESIDEINDKVDGLSEDLSAFSEDVANAFSDVNEQISGITDTISDLADAISGNTEAISELNDKVDDAVSALTESINEVEDQLDTKADKTALDELQDEITQGFEKLENKKADKTDLEAVSGAVDTLNDKIDSEIARATSAETALQEEIDELEEDVQEAVGKVEGYDGRITAVENGLAQEIIDRQNGDIALIGTSSDDTDEDTIWAAKNLAEQYKDEAIASAKTYTNDKVAVVNGEIQNLENRIDQKLTHYATEAFVISACNDTETEVRNEFATAINNETQRAERAESNIEVEIQSLLVQILSNKDHISNNSSRLNAITRWDGSDPDEYEDWASAHTSANGVLDVLHREFHEYVEKDGIIESIEYDEESGDLIIIYKTTEGRKETRIHVGDIVDLTNYYTKDECNDRFSTKSDISELFEKINKEIQDRINDVDTEEARAIAAENDINNRIDNLTLDCGIYY